MTESGSKETVRSLNFEIHFKELADCVSSLESGQLSLDGSLNAYQQGIELIRKCRDILNQAQARVEQLRSIDEQNNLITQPVNLDVDTPEQMRTKSTRKNTREDLF